MTLCDGLGAFDDVFLSFKACNLMLQPFEDRQVDRVCDDQCGSLAICSFEMFQFDAHSFAIATSRTLASGFCKSGCL